MRVAVVIALVIALFAGVVLAKHHKDGDVNEKNVEQLFKDLNAFESFKSKFGKTYSSNEVNAYRFDVFRQNLARAAELNAANGEASFGITKFSDLTPMEFKQTYLRYKPAVGEALVAKRHIEVVEPSTVIRGPAAAQPTSDWRKKGAVTPVKDQGQCGSCWAFSVTETMESSWFNSTGDLLELAPQQIVDCDTTVDQGCNGGDTIEAYKDYVSKNGLELETDYPYTSGTSGAAGTCSFKSSSVKTKPIATWKYATPMCTDSCTNQDEATLASNLSEQMPVSICVAADIWQTYTGGIIRTGCANAYSSLDHCVQLVGLDTDGTDTWWIVRNSWNSNWGEAGYIRLLYGSNQCGVADEATLVYF